MTWNLLILKLSYGINIPTTNHLPPPPGCLCFGIHTSIIPQSHPQMWDSGFPTLVRSSMARRWRRCSNPIPSHLRRPWTCCHVAVLPVQVGWSCKGWKKPPPSRFYNWNALKLPAGPNLHQVWSPSNGVPFNDLWNGRCESVPVCLVHLPLGDRSRWVIQCPVCGLLWSRCRVCFNDAFVRSWSHDPQK